MVRCLSMVGVIFFLFIYFNQYIYMLIEQWFITIIKYKYWLGRQKRWLTPVWLYLPHTKLTYFADVWLVQNRIHNHHTKWYNHLGSGKYPPNYDWNPLCYPAYRTVTPNQPGTGVIAVKVILKILPYPSF
jgi:hypothetical protein